MSEKFNLLWNPHYDFNEPLSRREIEVVDGYDLCGDQDAYVTGQDVSSPWGSNRVVGTGPDFCLKEIIVKPGYMLSLQRHRGREELWEVTDGILTAIVDGAIHEIPAGQSITLPKGSVHCMINRSEDPVTIREKQTGICRELDNIRLIDFSGRATYPLTTKIEFESAKLYALIQSDIHNRFGTGTLPHPALLKAAKE
jgi:mannose-6-phosphate isomerase-like protein (cupin superfamily)